MTVGVYAAASGGGGLRVGDEFTFNAAQISDPAVDIISDTQFILAWGDSPASDGEAQVFDISGVTITAPDSPHTFTSSSSVDFTLSKLSSAKFVVVYKEGSNIRANVLSIASDVVSSGTQFAVSTNGVNNDTRSSPLDANAAISSFVRQPVSDFNLTAEVLDVSGTTITGNAEFQINNNANNHDIAGWDNTLAIAAYNDSDVSRGTAQILDISSGTITGNTEFQFNGASATKCRIEFISATQAIVMYNDLGNSSYLTAQILDISSGTITGNTEYVITDNLTASGNYDFKLSSATKGAVAFNAATEGVIVPFTIDGTVINWGDVTQVESARYIDPAIGLTSNGLAAIPYREFASPFYGNARIVAGL